MEATRKSLEESAKWLCRCRPTEHHRIDPSIPCGISSPERCSGAPRDSTDQTEPSYPRPNHHSTEQHHDLPAQAHYPDNCKEWKSGSWNKPGKAPPFELRSSNSSSSTYDTPPIKLRCRSRSESSLRKRCPAKSRDD